jgi:O-antigen/teichoic acid export membrane protein
MITEIPAPPPKAASFRSRLTSPLGRVVRNSAVYTVGSMLPQAISVFLLPVFTRYLSPQDYGILAYSLMAATFFSSLGSLSIQMFIIRHYYDARNANDARRFFGTMYGFLLAYNAVLLAVSSLVLPSVFAAAHVQVPFRPYVQIAYLSAMLQVLALVPMSYLRATERAAAYVGLAFLSALLNGGLSLYLIVGRHMGVMGRFYGQLGGDLLMLLVYLAIMSRIASVSWRTEYVRRALIFCLPLVPAQFLAMFSSMSDRLVLERLVPLSDLGVYSVAAGIAATAPILTSGVYSAIQPQIFRMAADGELDRHVLTIKKYLLWLFMALICVFIALSRDLVGLLAGPAFHDSYKVATLLVIGILIQSFITNVPSQYLAAIGRTKYEMPCRLGGMIVGLGSMLILVPRLGVHGAGIASVVTALVTLAIYQQFLRSQSSLDWRFSRDVALMGAAAAVGYVLLQIHFAGPIGDAAIKLSLFGAVAAIYLVSLSASIRATLPNLGLSWLAERP